MAQFHGKSGSVTFTGVSTALDTVTNWSVNATADTAEKTSMNDTFKTYLAGFKDWTATVECQADDAGPDITALGSEAALVLLSSSPDIGGTAICTGISMAVDANDVGKTTFTFQGSGTLA